MWNPSGLKFFELNNHLGSVMAVINDNRLQVGGGYEANVISAQDYYAFCSVMPGRNFIGASGYRYGFNGKENDNDVKGVGNQQDYGMRIYDPRVGKFLSVDPLSKEYPALTPYQFASNSPISGIDLDGLEYLSADEARVEFKGGVLQLKVANFLWINRNAWVNASQDPNNWTTTNGKKDIGMSPTIASINLIAPKQENVKFSDIPGSQLSTFAAGQTETGVKSQAYNRDGRRDIGRNGPIVNAPAGKGGIAKGAAILDAVKFGLDTYLSMTYIYDQDKIQEHKNIAEKVSVNVGNALNEGMIPIKYQNTRDIGNIMNVILQGVNNTNDPEIWNIGMSIYNKFNPKPEVITIPSGLDNQPAKKYNKEARSSEKSSSIVNKLKKE